MGRQRTAAIWGILRLLRRNLAAFARDRHVRGIALITAGSLGVLAVMCGIVAMLIAASVPPDKHIMGSSPQDQNKAAAPVKLAAGPAIPPSVVTKGSRFGTIEIASSGIKGIEWHITPDDARRLFLVKAGNDGSRYQIFESAMARHFADFNTKLQDRRNSPEAVDAVAAFMRRMKAHKIPVQNIFIVISSGVADLPQLGELEKSVTARTGIKPDVITPQLECSYTFDWIVPPAHALDSAVVDMGSGNTKACYVEPGADTDRSRGIELLPYGAKTFETKVNSSKKPNVTFARTSARVAPDAVGPLIDQAIDGNPGFLSRSRYYVVGGTAWVTAMLVHSSQSKDDFISLSAPSDFIALRKMTLAEQADMGKLRDPFTPNQLVAGLDILIAISNNLNLNKKTVLFAAPARDAWMSNYLMSKLAQIEPPAE
jgi:hypothetical protein